MELPDFFVHTTVTHNCSLQIVTPSAFSPESPPLSVVEGHLLLKPCPEHDLKHKIPLSALHSVEMPPSQCANRPQNYLPVYRL